MATFSTIVIAAPNIIECTEFYRTLIGEDPVVENKAYVGFQVGPIHIGLNPSATPANNTHGTAMYWDVEDIEAFQSKLVEAGGKVLAKPEDVGGQTLIATITDPGGNVVGLRALAKEG